MDILLLASVLYAGAGVPDEPSAVIEAPSWVTNDSFGERLEAVPDLDGDGDAELLVGAPTVSAAFLYLGEAGLEQLPLEQTFQSEASSSFGAALAAGDLDGDGYGDLAFGAWEIGRVQVHAGSAKGVEGQPWMVLERDDTSFGWDVDRVADTDGDGLDELLVVSAEDTAGLYGASGDELVPVATGSDPNAQRLGQWGAGSGDFDGDGLADLFACGEGVVRMKWVTAPVCSLRGA